MHIDVLLKRIDKIDIGHTCNKPDKSVRYSELGGIQSRKKKQRIPPISDLCSLRVAYTRNGSLRSNVGTNVSALFVFGSCLLESQT